MKRVVRIALLGAAILFFALFLNNLFNDGSAIFQFSASYLERNTFLGLALLFLILYIAIRFKRDEK